MTLKNSDELEPGNEVKEDIFNRDGSLLVSRGTIINYEIASKLKKHDINFGAAVEEAASSIQSTPLIEEEKMQTSIRAVQNVFESVMQRDVGGVKANIPEDQLALVGEVIADLMAILMRSEDLLYTVTNLMASDDYTYRHSVNVCILSIMTANAMGYSDGEIRDIALGSLLHDIGKANVKYGLIQKPSPLTESEKEEMMKHSEYGYELIKDIEIIPYSVKQIVRFHHEKLDGSGYPLGLKKMEIPEYVRIVTLCDMFDAMTANRSYRKRMPVHLALEVLMRDAVYKIDAGVYRKMTSTVCIFPPGQGVLLSDGRVGIVSAYRIHSPSRPKVKLIEFCLKTGQLEVTEINLEACHTLFIVDTWDVADFNSFFTRIPEKEFFDPENVDVGTMIGKVAINVS
jgi:putative nucleotidyltransferase with HDIG domain